jgi:hypothetical protein
LPTTQTDPVLDAVMKLTRRHVESTPIEGTGRRHYAKQDALLKQLRDAIASDVGGPAGGALPHERLPMDRDAFEKYLDILGKVRDWHELWVGARPAVDETPEITLARAYVEYGNANRAGNVDELGQRIAEKLWTSAVTLIKTKLSPPTTRELAEFECPECGFAWYEAIINSGIANPRTKRRWHDIERRVALTVAYRPDGEGGLSKSYARCGCCETVWPGSNGIRQLSYLLEHPEIVVEVEAVARAAHILELAGIDPDEALHTAEQARETFALHGGDDA